MCQMMDCVEQGVRRVRLDDGSSVDAAQNCDGELASSWTGSDTDTSQYSDPSNGHELSTDTGRPQERQQTD